MASKERPINNVPTGEGLLKSEYLTAPEVAKLLKLAESTVYQFVGRKLFRATKLGRAVRFNRTTLEEDIKRLNEGTYGSAA